MAEQGLSVLPSPFSQAVREKAVWWVRGEGKEVTSPELGEWRHGFVPHVRPGGGKEFSAYLYPASSLKYKGTCVQALTRTPSHRPTGDAEVSTWPESPFSVPSSLSLTSLWSFVILGLVSQPVHSLFSSSFLASFPHSLHPNPHLSICPRSPHQSPLWSLCLPPHYDISNAETCETRKAPRYLQHRAQLGSHRQGRPRRETHPNAATPHHPSQGISPSSAIIPPRPAPRPRPVSSSKLKHTLSPILCWV